MSTYWVPMLCPECMHEDDADHHELEMGKTLMCSECGTAMEEAA